MWAGQLRWCGSFLWLSLYSVHQLCGSYTSYEEHFTCLVANKFRSIRTTEFHTPQRFETKKLQKALWSSCFYIGSNLNGSVAAAPVVFIGACFVLVFLVRVEMIGRSYTFLSLKVTLQPASWEGSENSPPDPCLLGRTPTYRVPWGWSVDSRVGSTLTSEFSLGRRIL